jgi:hypothetical protein
MATVSKHALTPLWAAIGNTPLADINRELVRKELEQIKYEHLTKPEQHHERRKKLYQQILADPEVLIAIGCIWTVPALVDIDGVREHFERLRNLESNMVVHHVRITATKGQEPPPLTPHVVRQFRVLDTLLQGRPPEIVKVEDLAAALMFAARFVFGKFTERQARDVVIRYRKRFIRAVLDPTTEYGF